MSSTISIKVYTNRVYTNRERLPVTVFQISGQIDAGTYEEFQEFADKTFNDGSRNLLLDLSEVTYIGSAGLRAIHHVYTIYRTDSVKESDEVVRKGLADGSYKALHFKLYNPKPDVYNVLKMAGFDMYLDVFYDLDKALKSF